jgi:hypothetical protein
LQVFRRSLHCPNSSDAPTQSIAFIAFSSLRRKFLLERNFISIGVRCSGVRDRMRSIFVLLLLDSRAIDDSFRSCRLRLFHQISFSWMSFGHALTDSPSTSVPRWQRAAGASVRRLTSSAFPDAQRSSTLHYFRSLGIHLSGLSSGRALRHACVVALTVPPVTWRVEAGNRSLYELTFAVELEAHLPTMDLMSRHR